jgi:hypothetical protein
MQTDALPAVGSNNLFGLVLHPDYIVCPLVTATAAYRNGAWICRLYGDNRTAMRETREEAVAWLRKWGAADLIIAGEEYLPNEKDKP